MELLGTLLAWLFRVSHDPKDPSEHGDDEAYPYRDMTREQKNDE